jgi:hypothetical protein
VIPSNSQHVVHYLHLAPDAALPALADPGAFKAIVLVEDTPDQLWQWDTCRWLASSGCRYLLAWGKDCEAWKEAFEDAHLELVNYEDVPPEQAVLSTSHEDDDMEEVFWFAKHRAVHPGIDLKTTFVVHVAATARAQEIEDAYQEA